MLRPYTKRLLRQLSTNSYQPLNRIELNRSRMLHNIAALKRMHPGLEIIPVLKGNAYGHGLVPTAQILNRIRCKYLAVDGYFEAGTLRGVTDKRLIVMGSVLPSNVKLLDTKHCSFVVQEVEGLRAFGMLNKPVRVHLEINTGMNRMGLNASELMPYLETLREYPKITLEGVMTHLADADNPTDNSYTERQVTEFDKHVEYILAAGFTPDLIHIAQTAGSTKVVSRYANAIRLGIGTYGINPLLPEDANYAQLADLQPVLELKSTIVKIIELSPGDKVSYNGIFTAPRAMRIGVLPLGYYEGLSRELSNKGCVLADNGHVLPIVGRVCMNHTMVDLSGTDLRTHDTVTVISGDPSSPNSINNLQAQHGLFAYASLTSLSSSVRREIV